MTKFWLGHDESTAGLSAPLEDYLEAIFDLSAAPNRPRVGAIAQRLAVHKSTVTAALKRLARKGLIQYEPYGTVLLTPKGRHVAERIVQGHNILCRFFREVLHIPPRLAEANACRIEHLIDSLVRDRLAAMLRRHNSSMPRPSRPQPHERSPSSRAVCRIKTEPTTMKKCTS